MMNQLSIGKQIEKYRVDNALGHGGMGSVFLAYDQELKRTVALKVMHAHLAQKPHFVDRFLLEAQTAAQLSDHPSIVNIFDFKQGGQFLYLVMEHVKGGSLGSYMRGMVEKGQIIKVAEALTLSIQVIEALGHAHRQSPPVIHRDIKPDNILLRPLNTPAKEARFQAVVTDFGLAKLLNEDNRTRTGGIMGTLSYMSPEQAMGKPLDGRSDLYSVGVMLFYLLTGQLPLNIKSAPEALTALQHQPPPMLSEVRPGLPPQLEGIVAKTLAKNPDERYATAELLASALRSVLHQPALLADVEPPHQGTVISLATQLWEASIASAPSIFPDSQAAPTFASDYVVVVKRGQPPRTIPLDISNITIGRTGENKITLPANEISRHHAQLVRSSGGWQISDLGSTNHTFLGGKALPPHQPHAWASRQTVRIGPYALRWYPANTPEALGITEFQTSILQSVVQDGGRTFRSQSGRLGVVVNPTAVRVVENVAHFEVNLFNQGVVADRLALSVPDLPQAWVEIQEREHHLAVGEQLTTSVVVRLPEQSSIGAGKRPFQLQVDSTVDTADSVVIPCQLELAQQEQFSLEMTPPLLENGGSSQLVIHNEGNTRTLFQVDESGADESLAVELVETQLSIVPGRSKQAAVTVGVKKRPLFGATKTIPFQLAVQSGGGQTQRVEGQVKVTPRVAGWVMPAVLLTAILFSAVFAGLPLIRPLLNPTPTVGAVVLLPTLTPTGEAGAAGAAGSGDNVQLVGSDGAVSTSTLAPSATPLPIDTPAAGETGTGVVTLPTVLPTDTAVPTHTATPLPADTATLPPPPTLTPTHTPPPTATATSAPTDTPTPALEPTDTPTPLVFVVPGILVPIVPNVPIEDKDCLDYDEDSLSIVNEGASGWLLTDGRSRMKVLDNQQDAEAALAVAKAHSEQCFIGRGNNRENRRDYIVRYWQVGTGVAVNVEHEDCIDYDEDNLSIVNEGASGWLLTDGSSRMLILDNQQDAQDALLLAKSYSEQCFIGRGNSRADRKLYIMQYWK